MIASLRGKITAKQLPVVVVDVGGVGYEVMMPDSAFDILPGIGEDIIVHVAPVIRDDSHTLYGFLSTDERTVFKILTRISGIGSKSALSLLSELGTTSLANAVEAGDAKVLAKAHGIGRKTAERILVELRGSDTLVVTSATVPIISRAIEALTTLGFTSAQARNALTGVGTAGKNVEDLVKTALQELTATVKNS